jgi:hypothetical protein
MSYRWRHLLNQLPIAFGMRSDRRLRTARTKQAQFACYLEESGYRAHNVDRYERSLRRRRSRKACSCGRPRSAAPGSCSKARGPLSTF